MMDIHLIVGMYIKYIKTFFLNSLILIVEVRHSSKTRRSALGLESAHFSLWMWKFQSIRISCTKKSASSSFSAFSSSLAPTAHFGSVWGLDVTAGALHVTGRQLVHYSVVQFGTVLFWRRRGFYFFFVCWFFFKIPARRANILPVQ